MEPQLHIVAIILPNVTFKFIFQIFPGIRYIAVHAFLEFQGFVPTHVIALPVLRTVRALTPILLHEVVSDFHLLRRRLVEAGEITAHHQEIGTHSQRQYHMVIVYQTTIATDRDINAVSFEILVTSFRYVDQGGSLSATDTFLLTGDTDGTTTDTYLDEIRSGVSQVVETILVNHVSGTNQYLVSVGILDPVQGLVLPFG